MRTWVGRTFVSVISILVVSCGKGAVTPSPPMTLSGTWSGVIGQGSGGGRALRVAWSATQDGSTVSGPASVLTSPPVTDVIFSGTLAGRITGSQISLTLSAQPLPGSDCRLTGTGTAAIATGTLAGSLDVHFTSCGPPEPPSSNELVLREQ
jgi:hypothetical protein